MKLTQFCLSLALAPALVLAGSVDSLWSTSYNGITTTQFNQAADMWVDTVRGAVYVCGSGERDYANQTDMLLVKYNENGDTLWSRVIGGNTWSQDDMAHAMVADSAGNIFVAGVTGNVAPRGADATWAKYSPDGTLLWIKKSLWPDDDAAFDLTLGTGSDLYLCGARTDSVLGLARYLVMRVNPATGDTVWTRSFLLDTLANSRRHQPRRDAHPDFFDDFDAWDNCATAIIPSPGGGLLVTGFGLSYDYEREWWTMRLSTSGDTLWTASYHHPNTLYHDDDVAFDLVASPVGDVYVVGFDYYELSASGEGYNFAVARYDLLGQLLARRSYNIAAEDGDDYAFSVCLDDSTPANVYVTGVLAYPAPLDEQTTTVKLSQDLQNRWGTTGAAFGASGDERGYRILHRRGRLYVTGRRDLDMALLCYTTANPGLGQQKDTLWSYTYSGPGNYEDYSVAVAVPDSNRIYVAGQSLRSTWTSMFLQRLARGQRDVLPTRITAPTGVIEDGDTVVPGAVFANRGSLSSRFRAFMRIGAGYRDSSDIVLGPGESTAVTFDDWIAHPAGWHAVRCSISATSDSNRQNDVLADSVLVVGRDVGCTRIVAPTGTTDSGLPVVPQAWVRNFGNDFVSCYVRMTVGAEYLDSQYVNLMPMGDVLVSFAAWRPQTLGRLAVACSTMLAGDANPGNDRARDSVLIVRTDIIDVGAVRFLAPADTEEFGGVVSPRVLFRNYGNVPTPFPAILVIEPQYRDIQMVEALLPGDSVTVEFAPWLAEPAGLVQATAFPELVGNRNPGNDTAYHTVFVRQRDAAVLGVVAPRGTIDSGTTVTPMSTVANYGTATERITVWFRIHSAALAGAEAVRAAVPAAIRADLAPRAALPEHDQVYEDSTSVVLAPGESLVAGFRPWTASPSGNFRTESYAVLAGDANPTNDSAFGTVSVIARVVDVGAMSIVDPHGVVDTGDTVTPRALVENFGTESARFMVRFTIGAGYADSQLVTLNPGQSDTVRFRLWTAESIGTHATRCSTMLAGDQNPANDTVSDSVIVGDTTGITERVAGRSIPHDLALQPSTPSPFRERTSIRFGLPRAVPVTLRIFSACGTLVRTLLSGTREPGWYDMVWDGNDHSGRKVPAGTYYCRLQSGSTSKANRLVKSE